MNGTPGKPGDDLACPNCGAAIRVTEVLQARATEQVRRDMEAEFARRQKDAAAKAVESASLELNALRAEVEEKGRKLLDAQKAELDLRRREKALTEQAQEADLRIQRQLAEERAKVQEATTKQVLESQRLEMAEKDKQLADAKAQLDAARQKMAQGSQQAQGEVMELDLEATLREHHPFDEITAVEKGARGGDIVQVVRTPSGTACGKILWESKRTKNWSEGWIDKLKQDQREAKADVAVLVSEALPKDVTTFAQRQSIWVCSREAFVPVSMALRDLLLQIDHARTTAAHKDDRLEALWRYMTGPEFKQKLETIHDVFHRLRADLEKEKTATINRWESRSKQIDLAVAAISQLHGGPRGILGDSMPSIPKLEEGEEPPPAQP